VVRAVVQSVINGGGSGARRCMCMSGAGTGAGLLTSVGGAPLQNKILQKQLRKQKPSTNPGATLN